MLDALDDSICARILSFTCSPRDAVRLAAVSKRMRRVEPNVRYVSMLVAARDAAAHRPAVRWLRERACRVAGVRIDCEDAQCGVLLAAHELARAMPCAAELDMRSSLFRDILATLSRDCAPMTALLKRHVAARLGGATRDGVSELDDEMMSKYCYDTDHDAYARASFAWSCHTISAGVKDQLELELHMWQSADKQECEIKLQVSRRSNRDPLGFPAIVYGDENTTDWWPQAAEVYSVVKKYELWPLEDDDDDEYFDDSEFDDDDDDEEFDDDDEEEFDDELLGEPDYE